MLCSLPNCWMKMLGKLRYNDKYLWWVFVKQEKSTHWQLLINSPHIPVCLWNYFVSKSKYSCFYFVFCVRSLSIKLKFVKIFWDFLSWLWSLLSGFLFGFWHFITTIPPIETIPHSQLLYSIMIDSYSRKNISRFLIWRQTNFDEWWWWRCVKVKNIQQFCSLRFIIIDWWFILLLLPINNSWS